MRLRGLEGMESDDARCLSGRYCDLRWHPEPALPTLHGLGCSALTSSRTQRTLWSHILFPARSVLSSEPTCYGENKMKLVDFINIWCWTYALEENGIYTFKEWGFILAKFVQTHLFCGLWHLSLANMHQPTSTNRVPTTVKAAAQR